MTRYIALFLIFLGFAVQTNAQNSPMDTLGIVKGSVHMKGTFPYSKFLKKHKGSTNLVVHVWYNPTGSISNKSEIKAGADEIHLFYARNLNSGLSEMDFKLGSNAKKAFAKKKEKDLQEFIDFFEFDVFPGQHFNGTTAMEALLERING